MTNRERVIGWLQGERWPYTSALEACWQRSADPLFELTYWIETYRLCNGWTP